MHASSRTNGAVIDAAPLLDRARAVIAEAEAGNKPRPGRVRLAAELGVSKHYARLALEALDAEADERSATPAPVEPQPEPDTGDELAELANELAPAPPADRQDEPPAAAVEPEPAAPVVAEPEPVASEPEPEQATVASPPAVRQPVAKPPSRWPLLVIGLGAAVAVWSGWVGLGELTGFGVIRPLPGIIDSFHINTAVVLPLSVEAYAAYALRIWLGGSRSSRAIAFARRSSVASLVIGAAAQVGYHLMSAAHIHTAPWPVTVLVACVPVLVLGLASALAHLVTNDTTTPANPKG